MVFKHVPHLQESLLNPNYYQHNENSSTKYSETISKYSPFKHWCHLAHVCSGTGTRKLLIIGKNDRYMNIIENELRELVKFQHFEIWNVDLHDNTLPLRSYMNKFAAVMLVGDSGSFISQGHCTVLGTMCAEYLLGIQNSSLVYPNSNNNKNNNNAAVWEEQLEDYDDEYGDQTNSGSGGIILCSFAHNSNVTYAVLSGKFEEYDYFPLVPGTQSDLPIAATESNPKAKLDNENPVHVKMVDDHCNHFLTMGVGTVKLTSNGCSATLEGVNPQARLLANFSNEPANTPAIAECQVPFDNCNEATTTNVTRKRRVLAFNMYPDFLPTQENFSKMIVNAFLYASCPVYNNSE